MTYLNINYLRVLMLPHPIGNKKKFNKDLDGNSAMGAEAYFVLVDALQRAKSDAGPDIREALANTKNFEGLLGKISIGRDGNAARSVVINQVKEGKFTYVTTIGWGIDRLFDSGA